MWTIRHDRIWDFSILYTTLKQSICLTFFLPLLGTGVTYLADTDRDLEGWEHIYKSDISGGTINWTMFAIYLTLYFPQYWGDAEKLQVISIMLVIFWMIVMGCWVVTTFGSEWRLHETLAYIAMYGGAVTLAVISAALFVFLDFFFWVVRSYV